MRLFGDPTLPASAVDFSCSHLKRKPNSSGDLAQVSREKHRAETVIRELREVER